jgi:heat shock protein HtpX
MANPLNEFVSTGSDWRASLAANNRKTFWVITLFLGIYIGLGLCIDGLLVSAQYANLSVQQIVYLLLTLQIYPIATFIMSAIAAVSISVTFVFHDSIMLLGTEYREITADAVDSQDRQLYNIIDELRIASSLAYMPRIYIIEADYMNAFASGYSEKSALVAITTRLLQQLTRSETQAVMAHEMSHIRHMDIKLTLMSSVLANIMVIALDVVFWNLMNTRKRENADNRFAMVLLLLRYILPALNVLLLLYLSRTREYMADAGAVELMRDNASLASALLKIQNDHVQNQDAQAQAYGQTPHENVRREAYIFDPTQAGFLNTANLSDLFSTHPNLADRLAAIGFVQKK